MRSDFLHQCSRRSDPRSLKDGGNGSDRSSLLDHPHHLFPQAREGLVLPSPHLGVHLLIEFGHHLCEEEKFKKKKGRERKRKSSLDEPKKKTHFFLQFRWHAKRKKKASDQGSDEPKFSGRQGCQIVYCLCVFGSSLDSSFVSNLEFGVLINWKTHNLKKNQQRNKKEAKELEKG